MRKTLIVVAVLAVGCTGCASAAAHPPEGSRGHARANRLRPHRRPVVGPAPPHAAGAADERRGMTFRQFVVADSLRCSSRAPILTGSFPRNTPVLGNTRPHGGDWACRRFGAAAQRRDRAAAGRPPHRAGGQGPPPLSPRPPPAGSWLGAGGRAPARGQPG